jgi:hypothetical protein
MTLLRIIKLIFILLAIWLLLEIGVRLYLEFPLKTDFYSSIPRGKIIERQEKYKLKTTSGTGWAHLGWIADPEGETYTIEKQTQNGWIEIGNATFGSFLLHNELGDYRVRAIPKDDGAIRLIGEASIEPAQGETKVYKPQIVGSWQPLFKPSVSGRYINDHTVYQDAEGNWRLVGITDLSDGNFNEEKYFAVGVSESFPPENMMREAEPVADFGELAWAPHVIQVNEIYQMFWSPHKLHQMTSSDGITWENHRVTMPAPYHKFFRDPMVVQVAEDQWLLYTTARGRYFSLVDIYQSFDLNEWQYIRSALTSGLGSERNSPFASTESPSVVELDGHYYLSLTYNNDSFFWPGILLMLKIWPNPESYNETLVFHSDNPYNFGDYRGKDRSPTLLTQLETHAPEIIYNPDNQKWFITTAGWPWITTLTSGEVAVAPLEWVEVR